MTQTLPSSCSQRGSRGIAAQLLGVRNVRLYRDQALIKEAGGGITPWHQDAMYWPLDGAKCITMWIPLADITTDMGVLTFATGSHARGALTDIEISDASEGAFDDLVVQDPSNPAQHRDLGY